MTVTSGAPSPTPRHERRRVRALGVGLLSGALALSGVGLALPAQAAVSIDATVLINEVYGGGGNNGAAFTRDFVELVNTGDTAVDLGSWSVQYASATGTSWQVTPLTGMSIQPGGKLLVGQATGSNTTLPGFDADVEGRIPMSGTEGKVALVDSAEALSGGTNMAALDQVVDYLGWGSATDSAGSPAPATTNGTSVSRDADSSHTAINSADFTAGTPTPEGAASAVDPEPTPEPEPTPDPEPTGPTTVTIAKIQGTGASTPLNGQTVVTEGVVTAHYPTGGLAGFVIQTPGTGAAAGTASDAVFVYAPSTVGQVALGQTVRVTGLATEFNGLTQVDIRTGSVEVIADGAPVTPLATGWPADETGREALESMLIQPEGAFTVTDTYGTNQYGEVPLAFGDGPLLQPTEVALPGSPEAAAVAADNAARRVVLDDGASTNFLSAANAALTPPYVSLTEPVVVGASVTFTEPVIVDYRNNAFKLNPTSPLTGDGSGAADGVEFEDVRTAAPEEVGGDISVASFNVLNYFTTLGTDSASCTAFQSPDGSELNNVRDGCDQRGAWDSADFARQEAKIVSAINALDASVVGLMEIENSAALGEETDEALSSLVDALNDAAGADRWAFVPSSDELPDASGLDVITNAIIYQPAEVVTVGDARALGDESGADGAFQNAREPIGQVFAPADGGEEFLFVVNHFKSKGSVGPWPGDVDSGDGQGTSNESRVRQATALAEWVEEVQGDTASVILAGDFNSYGQEDPMRVLYEAGYADAEQGDEYSYVFQGLSGSLDHILVNEAASARQTGADVWNVNAGEALALEYSRFGYHGTEFHADDPYRSSDHDPVKVGLSASAQAPVEVDILTINDFHGRLEANPSGPEAGAAVIAGAVEAKKAENPNTLFVSAGDNIGASTFTSFIQQDNPTIDTLVASGLDLSVVGNHEFDRGFDDLLNRVLPRYGGNTDPDDVTDEQRRAGQDFGLGANVYAAGTTDPVLPEYALREIDGVSVAFIGTVTPDTATMVDPSGIADIEFGDQLEAANRVADDLAETVDPDVIVLLTHSGAAASDCAQLAADADGFGDLATGASPLIDAIVSAHTHQTYACEVPVDGTDRTRPVIQASEYGKAMGQLSLSYDVETDELISIEGTTFPLKDAFPADAEIAAQVAGYVATADELGSAPIGSITGDILRGGTPPGADRGVESSMGNWVADVYLWATSENPAFGGTPAQIALMNPGGLRADLLVGEDGVVTYKEAADVQPFANTLVTVTLTGAQLEEILTQQWKATGDRPKLHLGVSEGFSYEYVEGEPPAGQTVARSGSIVSMSYQSEPIGPTDTFTVVTNSFLANGGDGFPTFTEGTDRTDTGQIDLDATLAYFQALETVDPAPLGRAILATDVPTEPGEGGTPGTPGQPGTPGAPGGSAGPGTGSPAGDPLAVTGAQLPLGLALGGALLLVAGGVFLALRRRTLPTEQ